MAIAATIAVDLIARTAEFQNAMQSTTAKLDQVGQKMRDIGQTMSLAVTAPIVGGFVAAARAVDQQEEALAKLEGVLRATGGEAGVTSEHVRTLAAQLQGVTTFGDEVTIAGASVLLTFKGIRNEAGAMNNIFDRTLMVGQDLSAELGTDLQSSMIMLGKAIENPKIGLASLTRVGVSFSEQQTEQIKALVDSNQMLDAQRVILEALEGQVGGTAQALAQTVGGRMTQAMNDFGDQVERIGKAIEPMRLALINAITQITARLANMSPEALRVATAVAAVAAAIGPLLVVLGFAIQQVSALLPVMRALNAVFLANPFGIAVVALGALAAALTVVYTRSETFRNLVGGLIETMASLAQTIMSAVGGAFSWIFEKIMQVGEAVGNFAARFGIELPEKVRSGIDTAKQIISELRAPSLDLGVTGSNAAAVDALYGPTMEASQTVADALTSSSDAITAAQETQRLSMSNLMTTGIAPVTAALIENENKVGLQSAALEKLTVDTATQQAHTIAVNEAQQRLAQRTDELTGVSKIFQDATDISKQKLQGLGGNAMDLASKFTPLGLLMEILGEAFETLKPVIESLMEPFRIIGQVLGKALASILRALFPIIKSMAIAFTYVGQIFFKVAELIAKAIGYAVYGIGKAIDALPFVSAKGVISAGQALINVGEGFGQAYKDLGEAREEIKGLELPDEKAKQSEEMAAKSTDANVATAENTKRIADALEEQNKRPPPTITVHAGGGADGRQIGSDIARQLDDYYGRGVIREERNAGRVGTFSE